MHRRNLPGLLRLDGERYKQGAKGEEDEEMRKAALPDFMCASPARGWDRAKVGQSPGECKWRPPKLQGVSRRAETTKHEKT